MFPPPDSWYLDGCRSLVGLPRVNALAVSSGAGRFLTPAVDWLWPGVLSIHDFCDDLTDQCSDS